MASSLEAGFCSFFSYPKQHKQQLIKFPQVRSSQSFKDEGKRADIVDANMSTLRKRIEEVKKKEETPLNNKCCKVENGWNYQHGYDHNHKRGDILYGSIQMISFVSGALGFVFLSGSLCIFLVSFLVNVTNHHKRQPSAISANPIATTREVRTKKIPNYLTDYVRT